MSVQVLKRQATLGKNEIRPSVRLVFEYGSSCSACQDEEGERKRHVRTTTNLSSVNNNNKKEGCGGGWEGGSIVNTCIELFLKAETMVLSFLTFFFFQLQRYQ